MEKIMNRISYRREKEIELTINGEKARFVFVAPSARQTEKAAAEAEKIHMERLQRLATSEKSLREVYHLQNQDLLCEFLLNEESDSLRQKAVKVMVPEGENYEEKILLKVEDLKAKRFLEISKIPKEELVGQLVQLEISKQIEKSWIYSNVSAVLVEALRDENREKLFDTVEDMQEHLPMELLNEFIEALALFLNERGNAQSFPEPHIFKG